MLKIYFDEGRTRMLKAFLLLAFFFSLMMSCAANADDIEVRLKTNDGSTKLTVQDSLSAEVFGVDSLGHLKLRPTTLPTVAATGHMVVDSSDGYKLKWYDGSFWRSVGSVDADNLTIQYVGNSLEVKDRGITAIKIATGAAVTSIASSGATQRLSGEVDVRAGANIIISQDANSLIITSTASSAGGGGTPAGINGEVQFNQTGTFGASSALSWDNNKARLYVGATSDGTAAIAKVNVVGDNAIESDTNIRISLFHDSNIPLLKIYHAKGSFSSPAAPTKFLPLGGVVFGGYDGSANLREATTGIYTIAAEDWASGKTGAEMGFFVTPKGDYNQVPAMKMTHNGSVLVSNDLANIMSIEAVAKLDVRGSFNVTGIATFAGVASIDATGKYYGDGSGLTGIKATSFEGILPVTGGGTGTSDIVAGRFIFGNGTNAITSDARFTVNPANGAVNIFTTGASSPAAVAIGLDSTAAEQVAVAIGWKADAAGVGALAIGPDASSGGSGAVAIGTESNAQNNDSVAIGLYTKVAADGAMVIGKGTGLAGFGGKPLTNEATNSIAMGMNSSIPTIIISNSGGEGLTGNVGIATPEPQAKLHVQGNLRVTGTIEGASSVRIAGGLDVQTGIISGDGSGLTNLPAAGISAAGNTGELQLNNYGTLGASSLLVFKDGKMGIGTSEPSKTLIVQYDSNTYWTNTALYNPNTTDGNGIVLSFRTDTNGANVEALREVGGIKTITTNHSYNDRNTDLHFFTDNFSSTAVTTKMIIKGAGNVGVGTSEPTEKLDVNGGIRVANATGTYEGTIRFYNNNFEGRKSGAWVALGTAEVIYASMEGWVINPSNGIISTAQSTYELMIGAASGAPDTQTLVRIANKEARDRALRVSDNLEKDVFVVMNTGKVGIGTSESKENLVVYETSPGSGADIYSIINDSGTNYGLDMFAQKDGAVKYGALKTDHIDMDLILGAGSWGENIRLKPSGNVGIGTSEPTQQLEITGNFALPLTKGDSTPPKKGIIYKGANPFISDFNYGSNGSTTTVGNNTFVGIGAGNLTMGSGAIISGHGSNNTAIGAQTLNGNTTGYQNTAIGVNALSTNTTGDSNTAIGVSALNSNTEGYDNTANGVNALLNNTTGTDNTAIGVNALSTNTIGTNNTAIGHNADVLSNNLTNATAIGYNAKVGQSNSIVLGDGTIRVGIGTSNPAANLEVRGTVSADAFVGDGSGLWNVGTAILATSESVAGKIVSRDATRGFKAGLGSFDAVYVIGNITIKGTIDSTSPVKVNGGLIVTGGPITGDGSGLWGLPAGGAAGSDSQIQYNITGTLGASSALKWNDSMQQMSIGGSGVLAPGLDRAGIGIATNGWGGMSITGYGNFGLLDMGTLWFRRARGNSSASQDVQSDDSLGSIFFDGRSGGAWSILAAGIGATATENWTGSGNGTKLTFGTTANGQTTPVENLALYGDGTLSIKGNIGYNSSTEAFIRKPERNNTFVGVNAGSRTSEGGSFSTYNVGIGDGALSYNTTGNNNIAIGYSALASLNEISDSIAIGHMANKSAFQVLGSDSYQNVSVGNYAMMNSVGDKGNTAVGHETLKKLNHYPSSPEFTFNTAVGYQALINDLDGVNNTAVGARAGISTTTGESNVFVGLDSGYTNTEGDNNTALGKEALYYSTGNDNTAVGLMAGKNNSSGSRNIYMGSSAGDTNQTGSDNIFIGTESDANSAARTRSGAIGYKALVSADDTIAIGTSGAFVVISGTTHEGFKLRVNGSAKFGTTGTASVSASGIYYGDGSGLTNINSSGFSGILPVSKGGTNVGGFTANGVVYASSASSLQATAMGASGTVLKGSGGAPSFGQVVTGEIQNGSITTAKLAGSAGLMVPISVGGTGANLSTAGVGQLIFVDTGPVFNSISVGPAGSVILSGGSSYPKYISSTWEATAGTIISRDASARFKGTLIGSADTAGNAANATLAADLSGGSSGQFLYQNGPGDTRYTTGGASQILVSQGTSAPTWVTATNTSLAYSIVSRDASGGFKAGPSTFEALKVTGNVTIDGNLKVAGTIEGASPVKIAGGLSVSGPITGDGSGLSGVRILSDASKNTYIGTYSGSKETIGYENTALGYGSLGNIDNGVFNSSGNLALGSYAMESLVWGYDNTAVGASSLRNLYDPSWVNAQSNTALGVAAGKTLRKGTNNTFIGYNSDVSNASNTYDHATAIGADSQVSANNNIILGRAAEDSVGIGTTAATAKLDVRGTVSSETLKVTGHATVEGNLYVRGTIESFSPVKIAGGLNVIGKLNLGDENKNVAIGQDALNTVTDESYNVAIGYQAGYNASPKTVGSRNTFLGPYTGTANWVVNRSTAIGYDADVIADDTIALGQAGVEVVIGGTTAQGYRLKVINGPTYLGGSLEVNSTAIASAWNLWSDARLKDIKNEYKTGLDSVMLLNPVEFTYKTDNALRLDPNQRHIGIIAQELQKVIPGAVTTGSGSYLQINSDTVMWAMLNAIKELKAENDALKAENSGQSARIKIIEEKLGIK